MFLVKKKSKQTPYNIHNVTNNLMFFSLLGMPATLWAGILLVKPIVLLYAFAPAVLFVVPITKRS